MRIMLADERPKAASVARGLLRARAVFQDVRARRASWLAPLPAASSKRFWATQRRRLSSGALSGMYTVLVAAALNIFLLIPAGDDAARAVIYMNATIATGAIAASATVELTQSTRKMSMLSASRKKRIGKMSANSTSAWPRLRFIPLIP